MPHILSHCHSTLQNDLAYPAHGALAADLLTKIK